MRRAPVARSGGHAGAGPVAAARTHAEAIKNAKTPDDHKAIADAYAKEAENLRATAAAHRGMDSYYNNEPGYLTEKVGLPRHCRALTQAYEAAAKEADALAAAHRAMAEKAAKHGM